MFNFSMEKDPALSLLYSLFFIAGLLLNVSQYWLGQYNLVMPSLVINGVFLVSALFFLFNRNKSISKYVNLLSLTAIAVALQYQLHFNPEISIHWFYVFPLLTFFVLPVSWAFAINVSMIVGLIINQNQLFTHSLDATALLMTVLFSLCGAGYALSNQIKRRNLLRLAVTDYQSGAYNDLHLKTKLHEEVARSNVTNRTLSLLAVTIEDYNQIWEIHGQTITMDLLKEFKDVVGRILRAGDEIFHNGQGTFYLLLPNCPIEGATVLKARLIKNLENHTWPETDDLQLNTGFATLNFNESAEDFLRRASEHVSKQQQTALRLLAFND